MVFVKLHESAALARNESDLYCCAFRNIREVKAEEIACAPVCDKLAGCQFVKCASNILPRHCDIGLDVACGGSPEIRLTGYRADGGTD